MVENNASFYREKLYKKNANGAPGQRQESSGKRTQKNDVRTRSFHYAIQQDGTLLGEALWKKRKAEGKPYRFADEATIRTLSSSIPPSQHRQLYFPRSTEISLAKVESLLQSSLLEFKRQASLPTEPKAPKEPFASSSLNTPTPVHFSSSSSFQNQQNENNGGDRSRNSYQQKFEDKNRAPPSQYPKSYSGDPSVGGKEREMSNPSQKFSTAADHSRIVPPPEDDEFDDDILDDFDPDLAVSEHINNNGRRKSTQTTNTSFDATNLEDRRETSFNYHPPQDERKGSNYGDYNARHDVENHPFINHTNHLQNDPNGNDFYNGSSFDSNNFNRNHERGSTVYPPSTGNQNNFDAQRYNSYGGDNGDDVPLCPGHGLPCRCLTANTSINMGREFYKCSLPEGQSCEFFQWKDGMEGNWNDNHSNGGTNGNMDRGQILEMNEENRRVFGHRSFRPGQKDVIEQAIQGRDVFVLMPTGYVKLFCLVFILAVLAI